MALAATGDPLPGIDVLVRCKGGPTIWKPGPRGIAPALNFGGPELSALSIDQLYPGSGPFSGTVELTDDLSQPLGRLEMFEGPTADTIDIELVALQLNSIDPVTIQDQFGEDAIFDVHVTISGTGQFYTSSSPDRLIIDALLDVSYQIDFIHAGGAGSGGATINTASFLTSLDPIPWYDEDIWGNPTPFFPGYDGGLDLHPLEMVSSAEDFGLTMYSVVGPFGTLAGDGNTDGVVDGLDYLLWAAHFDDDPALEGTRTPDIHGVNVAL